MLYGRKFSTLELLIPWNQNTFNELKEIIVACMQ